MLVLIFRKFYGIRCNHPTYQLHIMLFSLLLMLSQQVQRNDGEPTKWNRSIQRRLMWKQIDNTVYGLVNRVVSGARVMKTMMGDLIPPNQASANVMDYLPTETTRIKYIIKNPHTKQTKVIRVRPYKKVVKLMAMTPKPLLPDKQNHMHQHDSKHMVDPVHDTVNKLKSMYMMDPDKLRQLEKEQELIAEGRIPNKSNRNLLYMTFRTEKPKNIHYMGNDETDSNIISGTIQEVNESWKPIYKLGNHPAGFTTSTPYMMSALHTSAMGELLPEPQKQIYDPLILNNYTEKNKKKSHAYEVTEYTTEESVVTPYINYYYKYQGPESLSFSKQRETPHKIFTNTTIIPKIITKNEGESDSRIFHTEYRTQHGFLPFRENFKVETEISSTPSSSINTVTTTEEPNYPPFFLKKYHNPINSKPNSKDEDERGSKISPTEYLSQHVLLPFRDNYNLETEISSTTSSPRNKATTTEEPNYPSFFLERFRKRINTSYNSKEEPRNKFPDLSYDSTWLPSNDTYVSQRAPRSPYHRHTIPNTLSQRANMQSLKTPGEDSHLNSGTLSISNFSNTTELPILTEITTQRIFSNNSAMKNMPLRSSNYPSFSTKKHRNVMYRGSVKYGNKYEIE